MKSVRHQEAAERAFDRGGDGVRHRVDDRDVAGTIADVGDRLWGIGITPDGRTLYTANGPSNDVSVIDVANLKVIKSIQVGESPWGVAMGPK